MSSELCQSCGVPFDASAPHGTNADGSTNTDYCIFCYSHGQFCENLSLSQMIERQVPYLLEVNAGMGPQQAKDTLSSFIPSLQRWQPK